MKKYCPHCGQDIERKNAMPDKEKINKFLTEYFKLSKYYFIDDRNFFDEFGFFKLLDLMIENELLPAFLERHGIDNMHISIALINPPETFAPAVAKFLGYEEGG